MSTIEKIVTSSTHVGNQISRDRDFTGTFGTNYAYKDILNWMTPYDTWLSNTRTTYQPSNWDYRHRIANHQNATTALIGEKYVVEGYGGSWEAYWTATRNGVQNVPQYDKGRGMVPGFKTLPLTPAYTADPDAELEAKMKLFKTLKDKRQAWDGLVFLGELRELLHMVRHPAKNLRDGLDDYTRSAKKLNRRTSTANLNRALAGTWLEWIYGMAPTISDLENAKEACNRHLERYEELYQKFATQSNGIKTEPTNWVKYENGYYPWSFEMYYRRYKTSKVIYYGQVYTAAANAVGFTRQQLGLELRNFVPTVWEVIPYSFVADYFTNIGNLLEGYSTYTGDVAWISKCIINDGVCEHVCRRAYIKDGLSTVASSVKNLRVIVNVTSPLTIRRRKVDRSVSSVPTLNPLKDFRLTIPGVGSTKWINLTALFAASRKTERLLTSS